MAVVVLFMLIGTGLLLMIFVNLMEQHGYHDLLTKGFLVK